LKLNGLYDVSSADSQQRTGGTVRKANKATIVALALLFVSIWIVLAAGITTVWLTEGVRVFALVILTTGMVAGLLVMYFDWRAKLRRRAMADRDAHRTAA
jgi:uncharacterized membrane-anchored protein